MNWNLQTIKLVMNYENSELPVQNPDLLNFIFLFTIVGLILLTIRKDNSSNFLDRIQTGQLKGIAILLVVFGHLWVHVVQQRPHFIFGRDGVALFLLLSGYGLTVSIGRARTGFINYASRRLRRVMIPYWTATVFILLLDFVILGRTYSDIDLIMTFSGLNLNSTTQHIDYVRWYITFLIFWYLVFYIVARLFQGKSGLFMLFIISTVLFPFSYYYLKFQWYQFFAFPVGCAIGFFKEDINKLFAKNKKGFVIFTVFAGSCVLVWKMLLSIESIGGCLYSHVPNILLTFINEVGSLVLVLTLIVCIACFGSIKYSSRFLLFYGGISYEMFLIHGAFLVKYNPIIRGPGFSDVLISFPLFLLFATFLSYMFNRILKALNVKYSS